MKTIGMLGGVGWPSSIEYYRKLNELTNKRLGGYHSAKTLLKSVNYHEIMSNYGKNHKLISSLLKQELADLITLSPDCIIICCNSLHKYYDEIKSELNIQIPIMHALELTGKALLGAKHKNVLLLATKLTMDDGFFETALSNCGTKVTTPNLAQREQMDQIHKELMDNIVSKKAVAFFKDLVSSYNHLDAVVLGCTEYQLVLNNNNSSLPILDRCVLQAEAAVNFALNYQMTTLEL